MVRAMMMSRDVGISLVNHQDEDQKQRIKDDVEGNVGIPLVNNQDVGTK